MRNVFSCLLVFVLGCNATAGTNELTVPENRTATLPCLHGVGGSDVPTWSRDVRGKEARENIASRGRFHVSTESKTLKIQRVQPGDSGLYYCDGKAAVYLKVTEGDASERGYSTTTATTTQTKPESHHAVIKEKESITLPCPRSVDGDVTWSRETRGIKVDLLKIVGDRDIRLVHDPFRAYSSLADKSLHIFKASVSHSAKYFCNDEPAAELTVIPSGNDGGAQKCN
ncbi:hypothetical protein D5F01_LYC19980 [Larimichthys crocea]|uniref:Ig-like domain-containing protein n=1 Tax=Larimichthys crocea TaxID=215358 RepID=A0A6G0HTL9_LARCR|nr:hypothetical protein D5F01_LYC19980 [Larimichthys crocea]